MPAPYGLRSVTLARRNQGTAGHSPKGIGKKATWATKSQEGAPGRPDSQTIEPSMDGAADPSAPDQKTRVKADRLTPAYP